MLLSTFSLARSLSHSLVSDREFLAPEILSQRKGYLDFTYICRAGSTPQRRDPSYTSGVTQQEGGGGGGDWDRDRGDGGVGKPNYEEGGARATEEFW